MNQTIGTLRRQLIFLNIVLSCIASSMLSTALTTALPAIVSDLSIPMNTGQWLTSGYSLTMGITMPLTAFLITRFPARRLYLSGLLLFIIGLVLCAVAPDFVTMMAARILQAVGNGILIAMSQVIILTVFPVEQRGSAMGWYGLSIGAAPVIAPALAGLILDMWNWRAIFLLSLAIVTVALVWAFAVFTNVLHTEHRTFDGFSFLLSTLAFAGITLGIGNIGTYTFFSLPSGGVLGIGFLTGILFIRRQLRSREPFLDIRVLRYRNYSVSVLGSMLLYLVMMGSSVMMPLYAQSILGLSATASGLIVLPGSLVMAVISPFAGRIYDRLGMNLLFTLGAACLMISCLGMVFVTCETTVWVAVFLNVIRNASIGCLMMPLVTWGTSSLTGELTAHGTALLTSLRTVAGAVGSAVFVGVLTAFSVEGATDIHGLNITFFWLTVTALTLLLLAVWSIKYALRSSKK